MKFTREQLYGFGSSIVLCLLILLFLSFAFLRTEIVEMGGISVAFGNVEWAAETENPASSGRSQEIPDVELIPEAVSHPAIPTPEPSVISPKNEQPLLITQNNEQTAAMEAERQRKEQEQIAEQERREAERKRLEEEQRRRDAIDRQMADAFGAGNTAGGSSGTAASGSGIQGSLQGNAATGAQTGVGGIGSFDLSGRSLRGGNLPAPAYDVQAEGTIVVEITVNPQGDVIDAGIRLKGTNIENANMRRAAIEAAKRTKFNPISGIQNQIGTITYRFTLK